MPSLMTCRDAAAELNPGAWHGPCSAGSLPLYRYLPCTLPAIHERQREQLRRELAQIANRLRDLGGSPTEAEPPDAIGANKARDETDVAQRMRDANIGFVRVCTDSLRVVGTVTDRDLAVRVCAENRPADTTQVGEIMTRDVVACRPSDDVRHAERLMGEHQKARIMVIDEDEMLVGVISLSDIAEREAPAEAARTLRDVSAREVRRPPRETPRASRAVGRKKRKTA
jgi:CBS-domain-containing membrane protein